MSVTRWLIGIYLVLPGGVLGQATRAADASVPAVAAAAGDPARGRAIVANRQLGLCLLCHAAPIPEERFQGNLGPDLAGAGSRWTSAQLRQRLLDPQRDNPATPMPSYGPREGLTRVAAGWASAPILTPQQIEDVVAYLGTLRD